MMMMTLAYSLPVIANLSELAYIGPGGGLSAVGALLALAAAILIAGIGFLWYPLKRLRRNLRSRAARNEERTPPSEPPVDQALQKGGRG